MNWLRSLMLPPEGSAYARDVDDLYMFLVYLSIFFFVLVAGIAIWSVVRYRRRPGVVTPHTTDHMGLELTWSIVPLIIVMGVFFWGMRGFMNATTAPGNALEITVTAKKWVWQFEYPDGTRTLNEVHVPVGKPVRFVMGQRGRHPRLLCPDHARQAGRRPGPLQRRLVHPRNRRAASRRLRRVLRQGPFRHGREDLCRQPRQVPEVDGGGGDEWKTMPPQAYGELLYESKGCATCHSIDGTRGQGPSWKGICSARWRSSATARSQGRRELHPRIDHAPAGEDRRRLRADHADVPGPAQGARDRRRSSSTSSR